MPANGYELTPSYPLIVRDVLFARTLIIPFFEGFTARRTVQFPIEPEHLPFLGVYLGRDSFQSDGNWNHGTYDFIHEINVSFSVMIKDNDTNRTEATLHHVYRLLQENLWADPYMTNLLDTYNPHTGTKHPENLTITGIKRGTQDINWGSIGNNETPFGELQYDVTVILHTSWPPMITDDLLDINVRAVPMIGPRGERHPPAEDEVQRIILKYEFDPATGAKPRPLTGTWE